MKKILIVFLVACALTFVYGCGGSDDSSTTADTATTTAAAAAAEAADEATVAAEEAADAAEEAVEKATEASVEAAEEAVTVYDANDPYASVAANITQADIDNYIKAVGKITAAAGDQAKLEAAYKEVGWDGLQGSYMAAKIGTAWTISQAPAQKDTLLSQLPASLQPSQAEIDLVGKSADKIMQAMMSGMGQ